MPYDYLEDAVTSDVTFRAWGRDLDDLFRACADATTNVMVASLETIEPIVTRAVCVSSEALDLLLLRYLDELIFYKDTEGLLLRATAVQVEPHLDMPRITARLCGERLDPAKHALVADVKAVTLHGLRVERTGQEWQAQVTLDV